MSIQDGCIFLQNLHVTGHFHFTAFDAQKKD